MLNDYFKYATLLNIQYKNQNVIQNIQSDSPKMLNLIFR